MAKLGSSSSRPLLQEMMMLLALLLLASIQAGPVIAQEQFFAGLGEKFHNGVEELKNAPDLVKKGLNKGLNKGLTETGKKYPGWKPSTDGAKKGIKVHKYLCKAQGLMDKQYPGGASRTPDFAVEFFGGDLLSKSFPTLSCSVTSNSVVPCCSADQPQVQAPGTTMFPSRYPPTMSVRITSVSVDGQKQLPAPTPAYLSTTGQPAYTNLEITRCALHLREAVIQQMKALNRGATPITLSPSPPSVDDNLCYAAATLSSPLPRIAILLGGDNGGVMQTMELSVDATGTVWHQESGMFCLGIRRTVELLIS